VPWPSAWLTAAAQCTTTCIVPVRLFVARGCRTCSATSPPPTLLRLPGAQTAVVSSLGQWATARGLPLPVCVALNGHVLAREMSSARSGRGAVMAQVVAAVAAAKGGGVVEDPVAAARAVIAGADGPATSGAGGGGGGGGGGGKRLPPAPLAPTIPAPTATAPDRPGVTVGWGSLLPPSTAVRFTPFSRPWPPTYASGPPPPLLSPSPGAAKRGGQPRGTDGAMRRPAVTLVHPFDEPSGSGDGRAAMLARLKAQAAAASPLHAVGGSRGGAPAGAAVAPPTAAAMAAGAASAMAAPPASEPAPKSAGEIVEWGGKGGEGSFAVAPHGSSAAPAVSRR
jgi:hypothetical protein